MGGGEIPVLVADAVSDDYVGELSHDLFGGCVHEINCSAIIWFLEAISGRESMDMLIYCIKGKERILTCGRLARQFVPRSTDRGARTLVPRTF